MLVVALLLCPAARADLFTAQLAYGKGDYERAFKDYRELAELGQPVAQYNSRRMRCRVRQGSSGWQAPGSIPGRVEPAVRTRMSLRGNEG
jgi:hypothetical protein